MTETPDDISIVREIVSARHRFGHREHLELVWRYLDLADVETTRRCAEAAIRQAAASHGMPSRFHLTMTWSWVHLVALHRQHSSARSFDEFIDAHPALLDKRLLERHYLETTLWSEAARAQWVEPDRLPFPQLSSGTGPRADGRCGERRGDP